MEIDVEDIIDLLYKIGFEFTLEDDYYNYCLYTYKNYTVKIGMMLIDIRKNYKFIGIPSVWNWETVHYELSNHFKVELRKYKIDNLLAY